MSVLIQNALIFVQQKVSIKILKIAVLIILEPIILDMTIRNNFIYSFSNSNTEFELVAQDAADRPGTTIRRIKFVRQ
jgi:hypothetical protein